MKLKFRVIETIFCRKGARKYGEKLNRKCKQRTGPYKVLGLDGGYKKMLTRSDFSYKGLINI